MPRPDPPLTPGKGGTAPIRQDSLADADEERLRSQPRGRGDPSLADRLLPSISAGCGCGIRSRVCPTKSSPGAEEDGREKRGPAGPCGNSLQQDWGENPEKLRFKPTDTQTGPLEPQHSGQEREKHINQSSLGHRSLALPLPAPSQMDIASAGRFLFHATNSAAKKSRKGATRGRGETKPSPVTE